MRATSRTFLPSRALYCPFVPSLFLDGKEGVCGSSPQEGFAKEPASGVFA